MSLDSYPPTIENSVRNTEQVILLFHRLDDLLVEPAEARKA